VRSEKEKREKREGTGGTGEQTGRGKEETMEKANTPSWSESSFSLDQIQSDYTDHNHHQEQRHLSQHHQICVVFDGCW
jgi:hypothetical protein